MSHSRGEVGHFDLQTDECYDRHRFDNYGAWLDLEGRRAKKKTGITHLGFGYAIPKPPQPPKAERPFYVQEYSMTSGMLVNRKYNQSETSFRSEKMRTDPYHGPNTLDVQDADHYKDHRRRIQHSDPRMWKVDPVLRAAVSDEQVEQIARAERGESRMYPDKNILSILFGEDIKPKKESFKELNVDLSCLDLPVQEGGTIKSRGNQAERKNFMPDHDPPVDESTMNESKWNWCRGGRKLLENPNMPLSPERSQLLRSTSLPQTWAAASMLPGADGAPAAPYYGLGTRRFGDTGGWDGRMKGSKLARNKWAGTNSMQR